MIKSFSLPLQVGGRRDTAADYAISVAAQFNSHIAAIGFLYEPIPALDMANDIPYEVIEAEREANKKAAAGAIARDHARNAAVDDSSNLDLVLNRNAGTQGPPWPASIAERTT